MATKDKYRLRTVADLREKAKKDAAQFVALRRQQLAAEEAELERCQRAVEANLQKQKAAHQTMIDEMNKGAEVRFAVGHRIHSADLREQEIVLRANVGKQEKVVAQAAAEVEKALELLAEAAKELKVIEKHRENWQANRKIELERREQKLNDEIGEILYSPKRQT